MREAEREIGKEISGALIKGTDFWRRFGGKMVDSGNEVREVVGDLIGPDRNDPRTVRVFRIGDLWFSNRSESHWRRVLRSRY